MLANSETNTADVMTIEEAETMFKSHLGSSQTPSYKFPGYSLYKINYAAPLYNLSISLDFTDYFDNYTEPPKKSYLNIASRQLVSLPDLHGSAVFSLTADDMQFYECSASGDIRKPTKIYWWGDASKGIIVPLYSETVFPYPQYPIDLSGVSVYKITFTYSE